MPMGSTGLIVIANKEIEVLSGKGHPEHIIVCLAEMEGKKSKQECGLATKARHFGQAFCLIDDIERKNAVRLIRARQGKQTIFTGSCVNGPGQDDLAHKAVFATRAQSLRASVNNDNGMQGGLCHKGAVITGER